MQLSGKVAIITGAGSGIGRAIAQLFAREGARVVVSDYIEETGAETVRLIKEDSNEAIFVQADVSQEADVDQLVSQAINKYGKVDILVNNAGISGGLAALTDISAEDWDRVMAVDLKGPFLTSKRVFPEMIINGQGNIINIASMASLAAGRGGLTYTAAKHGLLGFTRQLAFMHGPQGIRVNAILPGPIETPMIERVLAVPQHPVCQKIRACPAGRAGKPEEVAKLALFLASDDSAFIHGAAYCIDGGYTIF
ncbi:MAG TPA: glucose 1-dehydrogenase [Syntrophomonadaceae bacterium]|nr:glucose 1-dehydrogenase [Syntrophomonadaceae bacterium]HQD91452.1 glucose 1-dehydrogenase [Syntrophomonadaceae bacterium]